MVTTFLAVVAAICGWRRYEVVGGREVVDAGGREVVDGGGELEWWKCHECGHWTPRECAEFFYGHQMRRWWVYCDECMRVWRARRVQ